jgi:hypothetical protein
MPVIRGQGLPLTLGKNPTNTFTLAAGASKIVPAGPAFVHLGQYSFLQYFEPVINPVTGSNAAVQGFWKEVPAPRNSFVFVESDGANYRVSNISGCAVGALVTNAGSGYTSAPTVTPSAGGAQFQAIVGGLVNTAQTVPPNAGSGYTIPPQMVISGISSSGYAVQARAHCTLSGGAVNAIIVDNQGAGYTAPVLATFITDPNDTGTAINPAGATIQNTPNSMLLAITGAGTIAAVVCVNPGLPQTAVPTLAFAGGGGTAAAATALMNFSITGYTVTGGGTGIPAGTALVSTGGNINTASVVPVHTQPDVEQGILLPRQAKVVPALSGGVIVASGTTAPLNVEDWGIGFTAVPAFAVLSGSGTTTTGATIVATVGGQTDIIYIQPVTG